MPAEQLVDQVTTDTLNLLKISDKSAPPPFVPNYLANPAFPYYDVDKRLARLPSTGGEGKDGLSPTTPPVSDREEQSSVLTGQDCRHPVPQGVQAEVGTRGAGGGLYKAGDASSWLRACGSDLDQIGDCFGHF